MAKKFLTPIGLVSLPSDPADGIEGQLYFNTTSDIIKVYANGSWAVLQGGGSNQDTINTASAAAFNSASANTVSQINALTTSDIEEGSRLYYTNTRGLTTASTALVHGNHTNITASYNSGNNQIILTGTGGGGAGGDGASVIYSTEQPDTSQLSIGDIWVDSNASVGYSGSSAPYVNQLTFWLEDNYGNLLPDADNIYSVGSSAFRVKDLYLGPNSLYIKSPNSNTNIPITIDSNNDVRFNGSKLITLANASANLNLSSYATQSSVISASNAAVSYITDGAPDGLNTLNEISAAIQDDPNFYNTVDNTYLSKSSASSNYLTQSSASSTYLTNSSASSNYLTQSNASSTYLTQSNASSTYLTQESASTTLNGYVSLNATQTLTSKTLTSPIINTAVFKDAVTKGIEEDVNIVSAVAGGIVNLDVDTASILYYTSNASANHTLNIRYNSSVSLNNSLSIGDAITVVWMNTNGATAYYPNVIQIDGTPVTPKWQSSISPSSGNANSIDSYSFTIIKLSGTPTYTVLAAQTRFA